LDIDNLTYGQLKQIAAMFSSANPTVQAAEIKSSHDAIPVIVCTDRRGVVFGYTDNVDARPINLTNARMCLYWSSDVGGVFGLAENGPTKDCKISAVVPKISLEGVTAIMSVDEKAASAWTKAKIQGR